MSFATRLASWGLGGSLVGRRDEGRRRLRPSVVGSDAQIQLETRVVMTVIAGPFSNPQDGVNATLTEVNGSIQAHICLSACASPVKISYESYNNATVYPTTYGLHNNGQQTLRDVQTAILLPGCDTTLSLCEGPKGVACDGQTTGTQFDVFVDPLLDIWGNQKANVAAVIAYKSC